MRYLRKTAALNPFLYFDSVQNVELISSNVSRVECSPSFDCHCPVPRELNVLSLMKSHLSAHPDLNELSFRDQADLRQKLIGRLFCSKFSVFGPNEFVLWNKWKLVYKSISIIDKYGFKITFYFMVKALKMLNFEHYLLKL